MSSPTLKPCPFCGVSMGDVNHVMRDWDAVFYAWCRRCAIQTGDFDSIEGAARAWNTRPIEDALRAEIEQLQVQLAGCSTAALGFSQGTNAATKGQFGWSPAYQDVLNLREKYEAQAARIAELENELKEAYASQLRLKDHICVLARRLGEAL